MSLSQIGKPRPLASISDAHRHYPVTAPCMNPDCTETCVWSPNTRGPSDYFCSKSCRQYHWRWRRHLLAEQSLLASALADPDLRGRGRVRIRQQLSHLEWVLARFPAITQPESTR